MFAYAFAPEPAISTVPRIIPHVIQGPFELLGTMWTPVPVEHGNTKTLGYRVGGLAYLTDFNQVPAESKLLLAGLDDLIVDGLRDEPHPMHQTVAQALALIAELRPRRAWLTHVAHDLPHQETNERLVREGFPNVQLAYDGLSFEVRV